MSIAQELNRIKSAREYVDMVQLNEAVPQYTHSGSILFVSYQVTATDVSNGSFSVATDFSRILGRPFLQIISGSGSTINDQRVGFKVTVNNNVVTVANGSSPSANLVAGDIATLIIRGVD